MTPLRAKLASLAQKNDTSAVYGFVSVFIVLKDFRFTIY